MRQIHSGSYQISTKDGQKVCLDRFTSTGELVIHITMPPHEARLIGRALLDQADEIDPVGPLDEYRGQ